MAVSDLQVLETQAVSPNRNRNEYDVVPIFDPNTVKAGPPMAAPDVGVELDAIGDR